MQTGELLTRGTVWLALLCYAAAEALRLFRRRIRDCDRRLRLIWTFGCAAYLAHVAAAFHFYHAWSHMTAYAETARQTDELLGLNWGGGLYFNYAFTIVWCADVLCWWLKPNAYQARAQWVNCAVRGFLLFMIFNATVVFGSAPAKLLGGLMFLLLALAAIAGRLRRECPSPRSRLHP